MVGSGEIGRALGKVLKEKAEVFYWDKDELKLKNFGLRTGALPDLVASAQIIFFCVPSWAMREALVYTGPYLKKGAVAVSLAKGLDPKTGSLMSDLLAKVLAKKTEVAVLGGALLAEDLVAGGRGQAVAAASSPKVLKIILDLFAETQIKVSAWPEMKSLALAGVLKNVYALGYGIASGLDWSDNSKGVYLSQAIAEMMKIEETLKGKKSAVLQASLLGDFFATSLSANSLNHQTGLMIARGEGLTKTSEGLNSLPPLFEQVSDKLKNLPILKALGEVVLSGRNPQESFLALEKVL